MAELSDEAKRRIVTELATFKSAAEVRAIIREDLDEDVATSVISRYDASRDYFAGGEGLRKLFDETRSAYVNALADIPIAQMGYRLRRLQEMALQAERMKNYKLAAEIMEQAAKDHGGLFTNVRQLQGQFQHRHMTVDEARERVRALQEKQRGERGETKH